MPVISTKTTALPSFSGTPREQDVAVQLGEAPDSTLHLRLRACPHGVRDEIDLLAWASRNALDATADIRARIREGKPTGADEVRAAANAMHLFSEAFREAMRWSVCGLREGEIEVDGAPLAFEAVPAEFGGATFKVASDKVIGALRSAGWEASLLLLAEALKFQRGG